MQADGQTDGHGNSGGERNKHADEYSESGQTGVAVTDRQAGTNVGV